jgi:hypothetical protein
VIKETIAEKVGEEIVAAGELRQGKKPSMASMITGTALIGLLRPRASKAVPKNFVLAVTPERVVAFKATASSDEDGSNYRVHLRGGEAGSWPRDQVLMTGVSEDLTAGGILHVGAEEVQVFAPNLDKRDPETGELIELLAGRSG